MKKKEILARFFKSQHDGGWWMVRGWDKPNKFYGAFRNLPIRAQTVLTKAGYGA